MDATTIPNETGNLVSAANLPVLSTTAAISLERTELLHLVRRLKGLTTEQWEARTRQPDRDVHALVAHVAGSYALQGNLRQIGRQIDPRVHRFYRTPGQSVGETLVRIQIGDRISWRPDQLIAEIESAGERAINLRSILLRPLQRVSTEEVSRRRWLGRRLSAQSHLLDLWRHRLEIADATGTPFLVDDTHDRQLFEAVLAPVAAGIKPELDHRRIDLTITDQEDARFQFGDLEVATAAISISPDTLAKLIAGWHSPAAARERSDIHGDVKTAMDLLKRIAAGR